MNGTATAREARRRARADEAARTVDAALAQLFEICEGVRDDVAELAGDVRAKLAGVETRLRNLEVAEGAEIAIKASGADRFERLVKLATLIALWASPLVTVGLMKLAHL
jgi:hypothetical protein